MKGFDDWITGAHREPGQQPDPDPPLTRAEIVRRAEALVEDIDMIFSDCDHWNRLHPNEEPLNPDPDGQLGRVRKAMTDMLTRERQNRP